MSTGWWYAVLLYVLAVVPTWLVVVWPAESFADRMTAPLADHECFFIYLAGMLFTFMYSAPAFGRTKANAYLANLTIAIPRGALLKVAGWSMVGSVFHLEPWFIGAVFFLFLLGASTSKDFSDMKGDLAAGCRTLPIRHGVAPAAKMIAPFYVVPWLLLPVGAWLGNPWEPTESILTGNPWLLTGLGLGPRGLGRLHGEPDPARSPGAGRHGEPPLVDAHVPDDDGGAGRLRSCLFGVIACVLSAGVAHDLRASLPAGVARGRTGRRSTPARGDR